MNQPEGEGLNPLVLVDAVVPKHVHPRIDTVAVEVPPFSIGITAAGPAAHVDIRFPHESKVCAAIRFAGAASPVVSTAEVVAGAVLSRAGVIQPSKFAHFERTRYFPGVCCNVDLHVACRLELSPRLADAVIAAAPRGADLCAACEVAQAGRLQRAP